MSDVVIVEAVRTPVGKRGGVLAGIHPSDMLATVLAALVERAAVSPAAVEQVVGGCVNQVGEQTYNITRNAWLAAGLPLEVGGSTVDAQCGSSQQATNLAVALIGSGSVDVAVACGVESMSRVPMGAAAKGDFGRPITDAYKEHYEFTSQFEGAERIAVQAHVSRADTDEFGLRSQHRAAAAWKEGRFDDQIVPVVVNELDDAGQVVGSRVADRDEGLRETTPEGLAALKPVLPPDGVHTAGSSSQMSDGAAAVLMTTEARARELGLMPRARVVGTCLVGSDPELMLTGPIPATRRLLERAGLTMADIDVVEINEAFASVVLAWAKEFDPDPETVNPNGGAIALGHPLGATGALLVTKALHELERRAGRYALVTMCCGGGVGTGTLIERL